jgi:L-amino acid N-acyltransferase YncA
VDDLVTVAFDRRYLYMHHGYTWPDYRGRNLHGLGLARALDEALARGYAGLVGIAERVNFASLRSAHRTGFQDCGTAFVVGSRGRVRDFTSRSARRSGFLLAPLELERDLERSVST